MTRLRYILLLVLLLPFSLLAQTGSLTGVALDSVGNVVAGAAISACNVGAVGIPCSPVVASTTSNGQGAFSMVVPVGTYTVTVFRLGVVATSSTVVVAPSNITVANTVTYTGNVTIGPGNLTVSGTGTLANLNGITLSDGATFPLTGPGLQAAINALPACSAGQGEIWITKPLATITTQITFTGHCGTIFIKANGQLTFNTGASAGLLITGNTSTTHFNLKCDSPTGFSASAAVQLQATTMTGPLVQFGPTAGNDNNSNGAVVHGCNADGGGTAAYFVQSNGWNGMEISGNNTTNFTTDTIQLIHSFTTQVGPLNNFNGMVSGCDAAVSINDSSETKFVSNRVFTSFCDAFAMTTNPSDGVISTYNDLEQNESAWRIPLMTQGVKKFLSKADTIENGSVFTLTAAANASGGNTTYTGTISSTSGIAGTPVNIAGFVNGVNNGTFAFVSATLTTITVANAAGVAETHAGTAGFTPWSIGAIGSGQAPDISIEDVKMATNVQAVTFTNANPFRMVNGRHSPSVTFGSAIANLIKENNTYGGTVTNNVTAANTIRDCDNDGHVPAFACAFNKITAPGGSGSVIFPLATTAIFQDTSDAVDVRQSADTFARTKINSSGFGGVAFGPGNIGPDTFWGRQSATCLGMVNQLLCSTAPTIAAAGCGGAAAAITAPNGTGSFEVSVGTTPGSACTITMPAATTSWTCDANTVSATTTTNFVVKQTGALSTTSVVLTLFSDVAAATAFQGSDTLRVKCSGN